MHTLFRCVTGGTDWGDMAALLITVDWAWGSSVGPAPAAPGLRLGGGADWVGVLFGPRLV